MKRLSKLTPFAILITALTVGGCGGKNVQSGPIVGDERGEARVQVTNNNWLDMVVYAERGTMRVRLGTVTSMAKEMLTIPPTVLAAASSIQLIASPIGATTVHATYPINVWPGDTVEFTIQNNIGISDVSTW